MKRDVFKKKILSLTSRNWFLITKRMIPNVWFHEEWMSLFLPVYHCPFLSFFTLVPLVSLVSSHESLSTCDIMTYCYYYLFITIPFILFCYYSVIILMADLINIAWNNIQSWRNSNRFYAYWLLFTKGMVRSLSFFYYFFILVSLEVILRLFNII
jgi:hypothetical protein